MSSNAYELRLEIEPRPSRLARLALVSLALATTLVAAWTLPPHHGAWVIALAIGASILEWRRSRPPARLEWTADGDWWIGDSGPWRLRPATVLTTHLVLLVLANGTVTRRIPLLSDSLPDRDWRRLRARLRRHGAERRG